MRHAVDPHRPYRQLISDRLDGVLTRDAAVHLRAHLAICPRCRMAERAYLRDRALLRGLRPVFPPRDLWARTAAALDREIAQHPQLSRRSRAERRTRRGDSPALMLSALASLVLGIAVVSTQSSPLNEAPMSSGGPAAAVPTPFDVPTQALAFVELTSEGLAIYQTTVDRVCPPVAIDCAEVSTADRRVVAAPGALSAVSLDLHEENGRLALLTIDDLGNDTVSVVLLPRVTGPVPPFVGPLPSDGPVVPSRAPSGSLPVDPAPTPSDSSSSPDGPNPDASPDSTTPSDSPSTSTASATSAPDQTTAEPIPATPSVDPDGGSPTVSPKPPGSSEAEPSGSSEAEPSGSSGAESAVDPSIVVPSSSPVPAEVQAVLEDVRVVGARPAWSSDGEMLAFSAMPVDASSGPDVYTWRTGEVRAQRLTDDGRSYFASWSGHRVVVSRPEVTAGGSGQRVAALTFVIDARTHLERRVAGDGGWLPAVDPSGRFAITWDGELGVEGRAVEPLSGALSMIDWLAIDPFAPDGATTADRPGSQHDGSLVTGAPDTGAGATPGGPTETSEQKPRDRQRRRERREERRASPAPETSPVASEPAPSRPAASEPAASEPAAAPESEPAAAPESEPAAAPESEPGPGRTPVEPDRDPRADPVREWQVRWSQDSTAFGFWVTETPDAAWGKLAVLRIEASSSSIDHDTVLLAPTLARRSFTLGRDRVAWVAPSEDRPDGELRLRTWGPRGYGSLRIRGFDVSTGLPAF